MAGHNVIADVSETLLFTLRDRLEGVPPDQVVLGSPADIVVGASPLVAVFLYQVTENAMMKNQELLRLNAKEWKYPPTVFDLSYLLIPYAQSRETEQHLLGQILQILGSATSLSGLGLQGSLGGTSEELRVRFHAMPLDEMLRLWDAFDGKPYKVCASYVVSPVRLDSSLEPMKTTPVSEMTVNVRSTI